LRHNSFFNLTHVITQFLKFKNFYMRNFILPVFTLIFISNLSATVRKVNNLQNSNTPYHTIQTAVNAAYVGDTVLVLGSNISYVAPTINKKLFVLASNSNSGVNSLKSKISGIFKLLPGAEGTEVSGFASDQNGWTLEISCNNVTIKKNDLGLRYHTLIGIIGNFNFVIGSVTINDGCNFAMFDGNLIGAVFQSTLDPMKLVTFQNNYFLRSQNASNSSIILKNLYGIYMIKNNFFNTGNYIIDYNHIVSGDLSKINFVNNIFKFSF
jgi:hypothetical protein